MSSHGVRATGIGGRGSAHTGLYETGKTRWFSRFPIGAVNSARRGAYGTVGRALAPVWRPQRVVVLSHMRSGSSLFTQLIASHEQVDGYGELHLPYGRPRDLWALNGKVAWSTRKLPPRADIAIDKVLHDYLLTPDAITRMDVEPMFLVREPVATIRSLIASFGLSQREAHAYVTGRLRTLRSFAGACRGQAPIALTYDDLVQRTPEAFELIEDRLGLDEPLDEHYEPRTRGGDPSPNIFTGRILRGDKVARHDASVDAEVVDQAQAEFGTTWEELERCCVTLDR